MARVSKEAEERLTADRELMGRFPDLLERAREAEGALREAEAAGAEDEELHRLGLDLDTALTDAMRAAYAGERVEVGARGYEDRIYRRKRLARSHVKQWTSEAERLLTLRETHRLGGIVHLPAHSVA
ncbi:MAG: hypothetical protein GEV11_29380 [Streptosporangiales bacterium]|nr:hypothetical protein [Streptosporangiales bacterium]